MRACRGAVLVAAHQRAVLTSALPALTHRWPAQDRNRVERELREDGFEHASLVVELDVKKVQPSGRRVAVARLVRRLLSRRGC